MRSIEFAFSVFIGVHLRFSLIATNLAHRTNRISAERPAHQPRQ
jgi:hypothetical protein